VTAARTPTALLDVRRIRLEVRLGHGDEERAEPQAVECRVRIGFRAPPAAVETDRLEDTVCYDALVGSMRRVVADREFRLVEHLAGVLFLAVREVVGEEPALELRVRKVAPPVPEIRGGAEFVLAEE
jgi:dihydroneopterin aldolase